MERTLIFIVVLGISAQLVYSEDDVCRTNPPDLQVSKRCKTRETCNECIATDRCCAWCAARDFSGQRCNSLLETERTCNGSIMFPKEKFEKIADKPFSSGSPTQDDIQIRPQKVSIHLRPNAPFSFKFKYKQSSDYPVDLYFLMDLSNTMKDDKQKLAGLGELLAKRMRKITREFRLGFGSFVDKVVLPFVNTHPAWISNPCGESECSPPYLFHNHMALSTDARKFRKEVSLAETSGNVDNPEGALDALMQAIVCKDNILWRETSRKLVVVATDDEYHFAGDGKLGGVVEPNDGACHLNASGFYTEDAHLDYPSVSQIRKVILKNKVNVIFAVTKGKKQIYEDLSKKLDGSTVGELADDSSNIVDLIQDQYSKITSSVTMLHNAKDPITVTFFSSCSGETKEKTEVCHNVTVGGETTFEAQIEIPSCPKDKTKWNQTFQIYPLGINEQITVDLRMICECDCEKPWNEEKDSDYCSGGNGTYRCGMCFCNENRFGNRCQCDSTESQVTSDADKSTCIKPNDTVECSGKGKCVCGHCECNPHENPEDKTTGQFCECDNFSCDRHKGLICGGPKQGICDCGECRCLPGWTGKACECHNTTKTCINPSDQKLCSGHGECECGRCKCIQTDEEHYTGKYCEKCVICPGGCDIYKDCVMCKGFKTGPLTEEECESNCTGTYELVKELEEGRRKCYFEDEDGCRYVFTYRIEDDESAFIEIQENRECPTPVNTLAISLGVIGGIVLIGLLTLLIWKLLTTIHDNREYAMFLKEQQQAKWKTGQNPLYRTATTTFQNPSFGRNE